MFYTALADFITVFHFAYVAFVVVGELLILLGWVCRWRWVRNPWFRSIHLLAIVYVAGESIFAVSCPLTVWEYDLRKLAGQEPGDTTFMERLVHFLFMDGEDPWPEEVYDSMHIAFGVLVLLTIIVVPPRFRRAKAVT